MFGQTESINPYSLGGTSAPSITSASSASGTVGASFSYQITASNSPTSFNATNRPAWLSVNTTSGLLSGVPASSGTFNITLSAANSAGTGTAVLSLAIAIPGAGTGLTGQYYDNPDFTSLKLTRIDPAVDFDWAAGSPDPSLGVDTFSVRWTGQVEAPVSGTYTFYTVTDDGARLWVNNQLLIDKWIDQPATEWSGTMALTAGQKYDVKLEYYENGSDASAHLLWSAGALAKQPIPQDRLYPSSGPDGTPPAAPRNLRIQ
jgi:hypothetical protein